MCVGNSLPLAQDEAAAGRAVKHMLAALRPGGVCVIHVVNIRSLPDGPCRWQKVKRVTVGEAASLLLKGVRRSGTAGWVDFVAVPLEKELATPVCESMRLLALRADTLAAAAAEAGASDIQFWGDYQFSPYEQERSPDIIMVARKREACHGR